MRRPRAGRATLDGVAFKALLFRYPGPGGWTFARIPERHAPPVSRGFGRTPVTASVDGHTWDTSVWRDRTHGTLLAVPARIRGTMGDGDRVTVSLVLRDVDVTGPPPGERAPSPRRRRR